MLRETNDQLCMQRFFFFLLLHQTFVSCSLGCLVLVNEAEGRKKYLMGRIKIVLRGKERGQS